MEIGALTRQDPLTREDILGVVLAGGQSRRFGRDKAAAFLNGRSLIDHVTTRADRQTGLLAISGRDYGLGLPVIADAMPSEGPLTGVLSALQWARNKGFSAIATFSCDAPFFPPDLVARLAVKVAPASGCSFVSAQDVRHPVFALWHISLFDRLRRVYDAGVRALRRAQETVGAAEVLFPDGPGPGGDMFFNINNRDDQAFAQAWLDHRTRENRLDCSIDHCGFEISPSDAHRD